MNRWQGKEQPCYKKENRARIVKESEILNLSVMSLRRSASLPRGGPYEMKNANGRKLSNVPQTCLYPPRSASMSLPQKQGICIFRRVLMPFQRKN